MNNQVLEHAYWSAHAEHRHGQPGTERREIYEGSITISTISLLPSESKNCFREYEIVIQSKKTSNIFESSCDLEIDLSKN